MYNECEVGDLSGKYGPLLVEPDGTAKANTKCPDPLAALDTDFVAQRTINPANKWSSIVFHDGTDRVLCAKLFLGTKPDGDKVEMLDEPPMDADEPCDDGGADVDETSKEGNVGESSTNMDDPKASNRADDTEEEDEDGKSSTQADDPGDQSDANVGKTPSNADDRGEKYVGGRRLRRKA